MHHPLQDGIRPVSGKRRPMNKRRFLKSSQ